MSGEVWATPAVISVGGSVPTTYYENVRQNISTLGRGGGRSSLAVATRATSLTLPNETDKVFNLSTTGTGNIDFISTTNRQYGNEITLIVTGGGCNIINNTSSPPAGFAAIHVYVAGTGFADSFLYEKQRIVLTLSSAGWHCSI